MNKRRQRTEIGGENGFEEWGGYMAAKKNKLHEQFLEQAKKQDNSAKSDIFENVSVFVNGFTVPSADEIKRIMMIHGGVYHHYFSTERTTHIIATNLPDVKIKQLKSLLVNIVKPEWITACLEAKRQVDFRPFLLYSHQSRTQPSIRLFAGSKPSAAAASADPEEQHSPQRENETNENSKNDVEPNLNDQESSEDLFASAELEEVHTDIQSLMVPQVSPNSKAESSKACNTARCATEPNFLSEFYNNSRLHHISTMAAMYKQLVTELRQTKTYFPGLQRLKEWKKNNPEVKNNLHEDDEDFDDVLDGNSAKSTRHNLPSSSDKVIMHIDMDCFFVSVGLRRFPHLKGQPVAVTHSKGNGSVVRNGSDRKYEFSVYKERLEAKVKTKNGSNADAVEARFAWTEGIDETSSMAEIASCSYEARKKGVKNGMFVGAALKLCPDLKVIPYDFEAYKEVANALYHTVSSYTMDIEAVSCDEMLVDCTEVLRTTKCSPIEFATCLRKEIRDKTLCPASTGFGSNRLLARLATRRAKPDGMFYLEPSAVSEFIKTIDVKDLPGVGRTMASKLHAMGITTCGEMQRIPLEKLNELGTKTGDLLFCQCRGDDNRPLNFDYQRKSISAEVNYGIRFKNQQEADVFVRQLSVEVQSRLTEAKLKGSSITLKLLVRAKDAPTETAKFMGHGICDSLTRSTTLPRAVADADAIAGEVLQMLKRLNANPSDLRGIGITMTRLENSSSSVGALDRFLVKNSNGSVSTRVSKSPSKPNDSESASIGKEKKSIVPKASPKKSKVFSHKGVLGIDQFMAARKKSCRKDNISKLPPPVDLDLEVLEALPDDIRMEVLEAYSSHSESGHQKNKHQPLTDGEKLACKPTSTNLSMDVSFSQVDPTFMEALPTDMRKELEADFQRRKVLKKNSHPIKLDENIGDVEPGVSHKTVLLCQKNQSILKSFMTPNEVKCMLRLWVSEENQPHPCDVHILEHYFCDLIQEKNIEDLNVIFKLFRRCVLIQCDLVWKKTFHEILSTVQRSMQQVYQCRLFVEEI